MLHVLSNLRVAAVASTVALSTLIAIPQSADAAVRTAGSLAASASTRPAATTVKLTGKLPVARRLVALQRSTGGAWVKIASIRSSTLGKFSFTTRVPSKVGTKAKYRAYGPQARVSGKMQRAVVTPVRTVTVVALPVATPPPPPAPPAPPAAPALGSRTNPYPMGYNFALGDWSFRTGTSDTDAWPEIALENMFNDAPLPGWSYVMVPVTFTYVGATSARPWLATDVDFLGSNNVVYNGFSDQSCGVIPNDADNISDLYPGGAATGNECAVVPTSVIEGGKWRIRTDSAYGIERFVAIR